jgi:hypothetical protein
MEEYKSEEYKSEDKYKSEEYKSEDKKNYDKYDYLGRNITEQSKRQNKVPWINAVYVRGKITIPYIKRHLIPVNDNLISFK